jgi:hypothetical protein
MLNLKSGLLISTAIFSLSCLASPSPTTFLVEMDAYGSDATYELEIRQEMSNDPVVVIELSNGETKEVVGFPTNAYAYINKITVKNTDGSTNVIDLGMSGMDLCNIKLRQIQLDGQEGNPVLKVTHHIETEFSDYQALECTYKEVRWM